MIRYGLVCEAGHEYEGWFRSIASFEAQVQQGQIACPCCGSIKTRKAVSAPHIATRGRRASRGMEAEALGLMRRLKAELVADSEYVGPRFADEARRIHEEESEPRRIHGEASGDEVRELLEDGILVLPLPGLPEDKH